MAALWWEFLQVFRGVHQLRQSPKFRALVEAGEAEKQALLNEQDPVEEPAEVVVHSFGMRSEDSLWRWSRWKRLRIIEAAEAASLDDASAAVMEVIHGDQFDRDLWDDGDDGEVVDDEEDLPGRQTHLSRPLNQGIQSGGAGLRTDQARSRITSGAASERSEAPARPSTGRTGTGDRRCGPEDPTSSGDLPTACSIR